MPEKNQKTSVLIVDDEERFRSTLLKILATKGFQVAAAPDGEEALAELDRCSWDIVLLDVKMPGLNGIEVLKRMRQKDCSSEAIILTGHASVDTAIKIVQHGAFDYLLKPCDVEELVDRIRQAYEHKIEREKLQTDRR